MAQDLIEIERSLKFSPDDVASGTEEYNMENLSSVQQENLIPFKVENIRTSNKYLAANPNVRGIVLLILRLLLKHRPQRKIHEFIANYFQNNSLIDIQIEIDSQEAYRQANVVCNNEYVDIMQMLLEIRKLDIQMEESVIESSSIEFTLGPEQGEAEEEEIYYVVKSILLELVDYVTNTKQIMSSVTSTEKILEIIYRAKREAESAKSAKSTESRGAISHELKEGIVRNIIDDILEKVFETSEKIHDLDENDIESFVDSYGDNKDMENDIKNISKEIIDDLYMADEM